MLTSLHKMSAAFVEYAFQSKGSVLDIGTAYGFVSLKTLESGAHVIANDLDKRHLDALRKKIPVKYLDKISFAEGSIVKDIRLDANSVQAVLASGVLHYLLPSDFIIAIQNIALWLKPGGKFFFSTPSPYTNLYCKFLPQFRNNKFFNYPFPGLIEDATKILPSYFDNVPKTIYLIDKEEIAEILNKNGFTIEHICYFDINLNASKFIEETNILGVISTKA